MTKCINDSIMKMKIFKFYNHDNENIFCFESTGVHNYTLITFSDVITFVMYVPACVWFGIINFIV